MKVLGENGMSVLVDEIKKIRHSVESNSEKLETINPTYIEGTYAEIKALAEAGQLFPGCKYCINNYQVHYKHDGILGVSEQVYSIILDALTPYSFSQDVQWAESILSIDGAAELAEVQSGSGTWTDPSGTEHGLTSSYMGTDTVFSNGTDWAIILIQRGVHGNVITFEIIEKSSMNVVARNNKIYKVNEINWTFDAEASWQSAKYSLVPIINGIGCDYLDNDHTGVMWAIHVNDKVYPYMPDSFIFVPRNTSNHLYPFGFRNSNRGWFVNKYVKYEVVELGNGEYVHLVKFEDCGICDCYAIKNNIPSICTQSSSKLDESFDKSTLVQCVNISLHGDTTYTHAVTFFETPDPVPTEQIPTPGIVILFSDDLANVKILRVDDMDGSGVIGVEYSSDKFINRFITNEPYVINGVPYNATGKYYKLPNRGTTPLLQNKDGEFTLLDCTLIGRDYKFIINANCEEIGLIQENTFKDGAINIFNINKSVIPTNIHYDCATGYFKADKSINMEIYKNRYDDNIRIDIDIPDNNSKRVYMNLIVDDNNFYSDDKCTNNITDEVHALFEADGIVGYDEIIDVHYIKRDSTTCWPVLSESIEYKGLKIVESNDTHTFGPNVFVGNELPAIKYDGSSTYIKQLFCIPTISQEKMVYDVTDVQFVGDLYDNLSLYQAEHFSNGICTLYHYWNTLEKFIGVANLNILSGGVSGNIYISQICDIKRKALNECLTLDLFDDKVRATYFDKDTKQYIVEDI